MKGEKGEGKKMTEPLFPRLHVNDREKGGPRAPPRNKMALYEQFSIPSQRFNSSAASPVPIPPHNGGTLVTSASSSQVYRQERSACSPSDVPAQPSTHLAKRISFQSSDSMNLNSTRVEFARSSKRQANNDISNADGSPGDLLEPSNGSNAKKSCRKDFDGADDFTVPTFVQSTTASTSNKNLSALESEKVIESAKATRSCVEATQESPSSPSPSSGDKPSKGTYTDNVSSKNIEQNHIEQRYPAPSVNKDSKRMPDSERRLAKSSNFAKTSSNQGDTGTVTLGGASGYDNAEVHPEYYSNGAVHGDRCIEIDVIIKGENSRVRKRSSSEASLRSSPITRNEADKFNQESEGEVIVSPELENVDINEVSEASLPDSTGMVISPDVVVGVIGSKHFWKARRAIVNQQRIFAIQVFELHRLIKVQKSLAASPDVIKVDLYLSQSPPGVPRKIMQLENIEKSHPIIQEASSQKRNESTELPGANKIQDLPAREIPRSGSSQAPSAPDNRANPCFFHPHQNQWLVPVMSPSEGLIYKPYPGPCPPTAGFMAPFYGSYAPLSFPTISVDFMNPASGNLPYPQQPPIYFPPSYNLPITRPVMSSSTIEQVSPLVGLSSHNVTNPQSEVISSQIQKPRELKGSGVQGSELTSPCENEQAGEKDAPSLFPASQDSNGTHRPSDSTDQGSQNHVIRVVPHNARVATQSAARIFRFIQQERKQYDS